MKFFFLGMISFAFSFTNLPRQTRSASFSYLLNSFIQSVEMKTSKDDDSKTLEQHAFSVAPMMDYTDRHQRYLMRLITNKAVLYTEMVAANALVRTDNTWRFLEADFNAENPLVLQLGGSDISQVRDAAKVAKSAAYHEINLNVGCPSPKVAGAGCFGAALMAKPDLVGQLALAVGDIYGKPATVKCRIGIDNNDSYEELSEFVSTVTEIGKVNHFLIHARKAILDANFSPKDNREIPPLKYEYVYRLVKEHPNIKFSINGGFTTYEEILDQFNHGVIGVMVGRAVINNPFYWRHVDSRIYNSTNVGK